MTQQRFLAKFNRFAQFARSLSELSTCKRGKVGAIVFPPECTAIWSIGYAGPARGLSNTACPATLDTGKCNCAHAEANAVAKLKSADPRGIMFTTRDPCSQCVNAIINCCVIRAVVVDYIEMGSTGNTLLPQANITVIRFNDLPQQYSDLLKIK